MSKEFILKIAGLFLGVLARMLLPWLRKVIQGNSPAFNRRYLYTSLASLVLGVVITLLIFPRFEPGDGGVSPSPAPSPNPSPNPGADFEAYFKLFCLAFGFGFGWNSLVIEAGQWPASLRRLRLRMQSDNGKIALASQKANKIQN